MTNVNSSVAISCRTNSNPPPHIYTFYKDGVVIQKGTSESFNITQVSYRDQGSYVCVPENVLGLGSRAVLNLTVHGMTQQVFMSNIFSLMVLVDTNKPDTNKLFITGENTKKQNDLRWSCFD